MTNRKIQNQRQHAIDTITYWESQEHLDRLENDPTYDPSISNLLSAKRMLEICDIAEAMTEEEIATLKTVSVIFENYAENAGCKAIKAKYNLSWNEIKMVRMLHECN